MKHDGKDAIVILSAVRTPIGSLMGQFSSLTASDLGAAAIRAVVEATRIDANSLQEVVMGCVLQGGQGQAPARQAVLKSGLGVGVPCSTLNKVCGSGMKAILFGTHALEVEENPRGVIVGGMESMSNAPFVLEKARSGFKFGHTALKDSMLLDGLEDAYDKGTVMGIFAERAVQKYGFTRRDQDEFAIRSVQLAQQAQKEGHFKNEVVPLTVTDPKGIQSVWVADEAPTRVKVEKIPSLKPAFLPDGTVTAASSSGISDGAAALLLAKASWGHSQNLKPLAHIVGAAQYSHQPEWFTTAPIGAIQNLLNRLSWKVNEVDLFEINEAFAVVPLAAMRELGIPLEKLNVQGGACALGHPIGASGARIVVTLVHALRRLGKRRGVAALCIGGGEALALAVELVE